MGNSDEDNILYSENGATSINSDVSKQKCHFWGCMNFKSSYVRCPTDKIDHIDSMIDKPKKTEFRVIFNFYEIPNEEAVLSRNDIVQTEDTPYSQFCAVKSERSALVDVPKAYLQDPLSLDETSWYAGSLDRHTAERYLLDFSEHEHGVFLIRDSVKYVNTFSLSVRYGFSIKHYRIHALFGEKTFHSDGRSHITDGRSTSEEGGRFYCVYLTRRLLFDSLPLLVQYYSVNADDLCCCLLHPLSIENVRNSPSLSSRDKYPPVSPSAGDISGAHVRQIERNQLTFSGRLGRGNYGEVWRGVWHREDFFDLSGTCRTVLELDVAIKTAKPGRMNSEDLMNEAITLARLSGENIVRLYGVCSTEEPQFIVTELMERGNLCNFLRSAGGCLSPAELTELATQAAAGMKLLEERGCVHRDLAARNVLVGEDSSGLVLKIADFGLARWSGQSMNTQSGKKPRLAIRWMAPEAMKHGLFSSKSDVWSFGILLFELFTFGIRPYSDMGSREVRSRVCDGYRLSPPPLCPPAVSQLIVSCWEEDAQLRPSFHQLHEQLRLCTASEQISGKTAAVGSQTCADLTA